MMEKSYNKIILEPLGDYPNLSVNERNNWLQWNRQVKELAQKNPDYLFLNGQTDKKGVYLTFDDAPDAVNTPEILSILKRFNIRASFSLVGVYLDPLTSLVRRIHDDGHTIINHTWNHLDLTQLNQQKIESEIIQTESKIFEIIQKRSTFIRPPYGAINQYVLDLFIEFGYKTILWSINTFDWLEKSSDNIISNVVDNVRPGDIILMHSYENKEPTVEALPVIISALKESGYTFQNFT